MDVFEFITNKLADFLTYTLVSPMPNGVISS
jgi:hypothetical protein